LKIKVLYFCSTHHGGFGSKSQSHILPIIWFLQQCELMWKMGLAEKFFLAKEENQNEAEDETDLDNNMQFCDSEEEEDGMDFDGL